MIRRPSFHGSGGTLLGIHIVNALLTLVTLGVYYFWAKTRGRRYLFSESQFEGDRFAYHGTGKELLLGFLKAFLVFLLPIMVLGIIRDWPGVNANIKTVAGSLFSLLFVIFIPVAMVGARRYRLSRTSWRGIRFSFRGKAWRFILIFIKGTLLTGLTFGLYYPFFLTERQAFMVSHSYFGNERFGFTGRGRDLLGNYLLALLLTFPTLGLCWVWFVARKRRFFWNHTRFGPARFRSTVSGGSLLGLYLVNGLLLLATLLVFLLPMIALYIVRDWLDVDANVKATAAFLLSLLLFIFIPVAMVGAALAWPWVRVRNIRFTFRYLALEGPLDLERIQQQAQFASTTGEGLAGFFDTGFDLG